MDPDTAVAVTQLPCPGGTPYRRWMIQARPVWSNRPGEQWPSIGTAARALVVWKTSVIEALDAPGRRCRGRKLYGHPPRWARRRAEESEARRLAAFVVRLPPGGMLGPAVLNAREWLRERGEAPPYSAPTRR